MQPTRRQALLAGTVAVAAGAAACTAERTPRQSSPTPDDALREAAGARERALVDAYAAALRAHPQHTALLAPLLGDHATHLAALGSSPAPSASPALTPAPSLRQLAAQERAAATAHAGAALTASRDLAALLASLAACEASHAAVL